MNVINWLAGFTQVLLPSLSTNLVSWFKAMIADGKWEAWELKKGLETVAEVFFLSLGLWLGLDKVLGMDVQPLTVAIGVAVADHLFGYAADLVKWYKTKTQSPAP